LSKAIDLTGQRFGRLKVTRLIGKDKSQNRIWECLCDCGNEVVICGNNLKNNNSTSCGCFRSEQTRKRNANPDIQVKMHKGYKEIHCKEGTALCNLTAKKSKRNTSGVKGVYWNKNAQKWLAQICFKRRVIYLGLFSTLEAAAKARAVAEEQYFQPILDKYSTHFKCDLLEAQE